MQLELGQKEAHRLIDPRDSRSSAGTTGAGIQIPTEPAGRCRHMLLSAFWFHCHQKVVDAFLQEMGTVTTSGPQALLPKRSTSSPPAVIPMHLREGLAQTSSPPGEAET